MIRIIRDLAPSHPAVGLAVDEAILETVRWHTTTTVRVWVNDRAVVIGRSQALAAEVDLDAAAVWRIPVLRRISGGGAVYHHPGNLNISVYTGTVRAGTAVTAVFQRLGGVIAAALRGIGIAAVSTGNMLRLGAVKIGGAAQARRGTGLLYHTTILVRPDAVPMACLLRAMRPGYRTPAVPSHPVPTASISELTGTTPGMTAIANAVVAGLTAVFDGPAVAGKLSAEELKAVQRLVRTKYGDERWTTRR